MGLCYPVISEEFGHLRSHENLLKGYPEEEKKKLLVRLNLDKSVTVNTVPSFIWTTASDKTVPAQNSIVFALELAKHNVKYELHIYPDGDHGSSTCDLEVNSYCPAKNAQWIENRFETKRFLVFTAKSGKKVFICISYIVQIHKKENFLWKKMQPTQRNLRQKTYADRLIFSIPFILKTSLMISQNFTARL